MHFPLFIELNDVRCLVVGSGSVASRKAEALRAFGASVSVVSPETCGRGFRSEDLDGCALVVAATDDAALNAQIAGLCRARAIPVNVVDDPANCTFHFPAIARKGCLTVAVGTEGACPRAAKRLRDRIAHKLLPDDFVAAVERLGTQRDELKRRYPDAPARAAFIDKELSPWND